MASTCSQNFLASSSYRLTITQFSDPVL